MTEHFSSPLWVDRVRGLLAEDVREEMDQHLRAGCETCQAAHTAWQRFAVFADEESGFEPPRDAVRVAKTYLAQQNILDGPSTARRRAWAPSALATLVFDSHAGRPGGRRSSRRGLFPASALYGPVTGDRSARRDRVEGRLVSADRTGRGQQPAGSTPASDRAVPDRWRPEISTFQTNEFGEFQCTFDLRKNLTLLFAIESGAIAVPLDVLFNPSKPLSLVY